VGEGDGYKAAPAEGGSQRVAVGGSQGGPEGVDVGFDAAAAAGTTAGTGANVHATAQTRTPATPL
jgi:hypothetical protein